MRRPAAVGALLGVAAAALATARASDEAVRRTFPPAAGELARSGSERFVIFAREEDGAPASIWELVPRPPRLVRRVQLVPSDWSPEPLFLLKPGLAPELVRLQVPRDDYYTVNLYHVDYRTWRARTVRRADQVLGIGATERFAYLLTDGATEVLDRRTLEVRKLPFEVVRPFEKTWLVRAEGKGALFDPVTGTAVALRFELPSWDHSWRLVLSPDARWIAGLDLAFRDDASGRPGFQESKVLATTLEARELATGRVHRVPVRILCFGGSGLPIIPLDVHVAFEGKGLRFATRAGDALEVATLDLEKGTVVAREAATSPVDRRSPRGRPIPEELAAYVKALERVSDENDRRLAYAFLGSRGVDVEIPVEVLATQLAWSADGKRFLLKTLSGRSRRELFLGDLERSDLARIPAPPELEAAAIEMACVRVP